MIAAFCAVLGISFFALPAVSQLKFLKLKTQHSLDGAIFHFTESYSFRTPLLNLFFREFSVPDSRWKCNSSRDRNIWFVVECRLLHSSRPSGDAMQPTRIPCLLPPGRHTWKPTAVRKCNESYSIKVEWIIFNWSVMNHIQLKCNESYSIKKVSLQILLNWKMALKVCRFMNNSAFCVIFPARILYPNQVHHSTSSLTSHQMPYLESSHTLYIHLGNVFHKHVSQTCFTKVFYKRVSQTCFTNIFLKHVLQTYFTNVFYKRVSQTCFTNLFHKRVSQTCFTNVFHKHISQTCFTNVFHKHVSQTCFTNMFHKRVLQTCFTHTLPILLKHYSGFQN